MNSLRLTQVPLDSNYFRSVNKMDAVGFFIFSQRIVDYVKKKAINFDIHPSLQSEISRAHNYLQTRNI